MDEFDFGLVHKIFTDNGWTYHGEEEITVGPLRRTARELLRSVSEKPGRGFSYTESGRFFAYIVEDKDEKWLRLGLRFTPNGWAIDEGEDYE